MATWAEVKLEAMFKRVEGGLIFRVPGLFPRFYLVTEAQKAEIIHSLMHPQSRPTPKRILFFVFLFIAAVIILFLLAVLLAVLLEVTDVGLTFPFVSLYFALIIMLTRGVLMTRSAPIGRVLAGARKTEQRITLREQNKTYARLLPLSKLLAAGVACTLGSALFGMLAFGVTLGPLHFGNPQHPHQLELMAGFPLVVFALLAVRFLFLAVLKLSLGQSVRSA
jgi:hypothetical protein